MRAPGPGRSTASPRSTNATPPAAPPLMQPTGENVAYDSLANLVNRTTDPFRQAPPPHQGSVGQVNQLLGGVLGGLNAPVELLNTGFALATNSIAQALPEFPAATIGALHVGLPHPHSHPPSLVPPAPPVPLPSLGAVMVSGCVSVLINGIPAARAGDMGLAVTCGSFMPPFEIFTGSSKVFIGGARAARLLDITKHCIPSNPMGKIAKVMAVAGMAAGALGATTRVQDAAHAAGQDASSAAQAEANAAAAAANALGAATATAQMAADAAALAMAAFCGKDPGLIPCLGALTIGSPNVLIGGFPMPSWTEIAKGLMKLARGLARGVRGGRKQGRLFCARCV